MYNKLMILILSILILCGCKNSPDIQAKFNSYLYQKFQVDNYELMTEPMSPEQEKKYLQEKVILIQIISDYNVSCLDILKANPDSKECTIIEYNTQASWSQ